MKLPKKIVICGCDWTVKTRPDAGGGYFNTGPAEIIVGTKFKQEIPEVFLHEVTEAILTERCLRYRMVRGQDQENGDLMFVMNHQQFQDFIKDLAFALKDYLK